MDRGASIRRGRPTVLVVAFYFPPSTVAGTFRTLRFVKYLAGFGWTPRVITTWPKGSLRVDPQLMREVPCGVEVIHIPHINLRPPARKAAGGDHKPILHSRLRRFVGELLRTPDIDAGWLPFALPLVVREALRPDVRAIYTTGPPFGTHLLGLLARAITRKPWLADFRDPWTRNPASPHRSPLLACLATWLESSVARSADALVAVTEPLAQRLAALRPRSAPVVIPNGYDPAHFAGLSPLPADQFTLTYAGSLYAIHRPEAFLKGVRQFLDSNGGGRPVQVLFVGSGFHQYESLVRELDLDGTVRSTGPLPHGALLRTLVSSHALIEFLTGDERVDPCIPCKLYEYLAARRPILMLARPGAAADLVRASGVGEVVPPDDPAAVAAALDRMYTRYAQWRDVESDGAVLKEHQAEALTGRLAALLDSLAEGSAA